MLLTDVNVLLYAFREDAPGHPDYRKWLNEIIESGAAFGTADLVLSAFLRIATHPKIFDPPTPLEAALAFTSTLRSRPNYTSVAPGPRHWKIFTELCRTVGASGNLVADAYLAALAIELDASGSRRMGISGAFPVSAGDTRLAGLRPDRP